MMITDGLSKVGSKNILNQASKKSLVHGFFVGHRGYNLTVY